MTPDEPSPRPASSRVGSSGPGWVPPSIEELQALLPQYEILSMLGHGGMGAVYKGRQKSLDRLVAIKILPPGLDDEDARFTERFRNEARTMAKMNHPGIVSVYDFGETAEGQFYFVMEYVDGTDVAKMIQASGKLPPDHALAITAHVCDALTYAHGNGVIHRDIKPANILINMQGQVKVADFGLAKIDDPSQTSGLTKTGLTMGTPDFVAPEALIMGVHVDGRADLYAIGVMLYQMLTGDIPRGLFLMPSIKTNGVLDPRFDAIITRAMQTDREQRYQTATEIRRDLDVILTTPRVRQDASQAAAAVPKAAVQKVPGQRSVAQKPRPAGEAGAPARSPSGSPPSKSKASLVIGVAATLVIGGGLVFVLGGKNGSGGTPAADPSSSTASPGGKSAAAPSAPVKVVEATKPKPALAAAPPPATATTNASAQEQWVDVLKEYFALPVEQQRRGTVERVPEGARFYAASGARPVFNLPGGVMQNVALRASVRGIKDGLLMVLRNAGGLENMRYYRAALKFDGTVVVSRRDVLPSIENVDLLRSEPIPGFDPAARHTIEFRAVDDVLTVFVDGRELGSVRDAALAKGGLSITGDPGMIIEKLEMADLTGVKPAAAASSSLPVITGWQDLMGAAKDEIPRVGKTEVTEDNGWLVASKYKSFSNVSLGTKEWKDTALRGRVRRQVFVGLRSTSALPGYYSVRFMQGGTGLIEQVTSTPRKATPLATFTTSAADEHDFLVTMTGPDIRLWVDGALAATARDTTIASGLPLIALAEEGAAIRDLAVAELPADFFAKARPAASSDSEQWKDWAAEWWGNPAKVKTGWFSREAAGTRMVDDQKTANLGRFRDVAVRMTARADSGKAYFGLHLRSNIVGNRRCYHVIPYFEARKRGEIHLEPGGGGKPSILHTWELPPGYSPTQPHTLEASIQGDRIICILDGRQVADVRDATITEAGNAGVQGGKEVLIEKLEYRELGSAAPTPAAKPASGEVWMDVLQEYFARPADQRTTTIIEPSPEGARFTNTGAFNTLLGEKQNVALRATVRGMKDSLTLVVRSLGSDATKDMRSYQAVLKSEGSVVIFRKDQTQPTLQIELSHSAPVPGFSPAARHTFEFRAVDDLLTATVDGRVLEPVRDASFTKGRLSVAGNAGMIVEKLELADLTGLKSAAAAPVSSTADSGPWSNALGPLLASGKLDSRASRDGERLRFAQTGTQLLLESRTLAGALSLRASARLEPVANAKGSHFWGITFNHGSNRAYSARVTRNGEISLVLFEPPPKEYTVLRTAQTGSGFDASASHTLEFRVADQSRTVLLDGKEMISLSDSTYSNPPYLSLDATEGTVVEKIEYQVASSGNRQISEPPAAATPDGRSAAASATSASSSSPVDPKLATLLAQYTNAVTKAAAAAAPAEKAAFDAELARLKSNAPLPEPAEDAKLPAELKRLRAVLRGQLK